MVEDGEWRWVVAMYRRKKCGGNRERERERSWKRKAEKAGAGRENTGVRRVSQRGCWWWTGKESGEKARRDHHCPGENSVQPSSDPMKRSHPGCWPTMISTESFEPFRGMESLLMAQRATNQNPFVVLLPPQFVVSLERKGGKRYIYIDLLSCALFFKRFPRRIGQLIIRRRQYGESLGIEKYSWMEIIDIDSGRMTITMKGLKRDEFGVNEIRRGREREKKAPFK